MTLNDRIVIVIFDSESASKIQIESFTPSPRIVEKINELQAITFDEEYARNAQKVTAPTKQEMCKIQLFV